MIGRRPAPCWVVTGPGGGEWHCATSGLALIVAERQLAAPAAGYREFLVPVITGPVYCWTASCDDAQCAGHDDGAADRGTHFPSEDALRQPAEKDGWTFTRAGRAWCPAHPAAKGRL